MSREDLDRLRDFVMILFCAAIIYVAANRERDATIRRIDAIERVYSQRIVDLERQSRNVVWDHHNLVGVLKENDLVAESLTPISTKKEEP